MIGELLANNRRWAASEGPGERFIGPTRLPRHFWIGCSDCRAPAHEIVGLDPGELFVHRNVANLCPAQDAKFVSALQFALDVLSVHDVIVCGHQDCGGVRAALAFERGGLMDRWLGPVRDLRRRHAADLDAIFDVEARVAEACVRNVREQVANLARSPLVLAAWERGQPLAVHGWIYAEQARLLHDLGASVDGPAPRRPAGLVS